jgi:class 3 adenylate cyclase
MNKRFRYLYILLAFLPATAGLFGQGSIVLSDPHKFYTHEGVFAIREDAHREFTAAALDDPSFAGGFRPAAEADFHLGLRRSAIWYRFSLENAAGTRWLIQAGNPTAQEVTLYVPRADGRCDSLAARLSQRIDERPWPSNRYMFELPFPDGPRQTYYLRITSDHALELLPRIGTLEAFFSGNHSIDIAAGMYLGFILVIVLFNFFVFISLRDRSYLYYIVYVLCLGIVVSMHDGYSFELFWPDAPWLNAYIDVPTSLAGIFGGIFTMKFLQTRQEAPRLHRGLLALIVLYALAGLLAIAGFAFEATVMVLYVSGVSAVFVFATAVYIYRKGYKPARYYLLAWGALLACILAFVLGSVGVLPFDALGTDPLLLGSAAESLLLSFALASRFNTYRQEKEELMQRQNELLERRVQARTVELHREKQEAESLLLNILPQEVAAELKRNGRAEARDFAAVTVMFTDFKDFTAIAEQLPPAELVSQLDYFFSAFDRVIQQHGLEKIKTMGDAYMCVGGLPTENPMHASDVVLAALAIRDFMLRDRSARLAAGQPLFEIRIGVHTGPVVAGIVGVRKFAYDIWGNTVNLAARMESSGIAGEVNVSGATYELIKDDFQCVYRGKVDTKNKGKSDMYFVNNPRPSFVPPPRSQPRNTESSLIW